MNPLLKLPILKRKCVYCGDNYQPIKHDQKCCCKDCRDNYQRLGRKGKTTSYTINRVSEQRTRIMTDEEQAQIDKEVFIRTAVHFDTPRTYKPGDPEWNNIVATITPIENIPKERFHYHRTIKPF